MTSRTAPAPFAFAGMPLASWSLAFRIWIAVVVALYAGFWLQLDSASSAAITVAILAFPTRGQALEKAGFRLIGTIIGVAASIVLVGAFSQTRDVLLEHQYRPLNRRRAITRRLKMTGQNVGLADPIVGEKPIGGLGVGPILANQRNALRALRKWLRKASPFPQHRQEWTQ